MARDYTINPLLIEAGLTLPNNVLLDYRFRGMSAEEIYNQIDPEDEGSSDDVSQQALSSESEVRIPQKETRVGMQLPRNLLHRKLRAGLARFWMLRKQQSLLLSTNRSANGRLPSSSPKAFQGSPVGNHPRRLLLGPPQPPTYLGRTLPARRYLRRVGEIAIAVDCSGSINARQLGLFEAEIQSILAGQRPRRVHVLYFDAIVHRVDSYECGRPISLSPVGGGGTDFRPCFDWLEEQGIVPQALVFLTDLCGSFPDQAPGYPVIWAATGKQPAPFGEVVSMVAA